MKMMMSVQVSARMCVHAFVCALHVGMHACAHFAAQGQLSLMPLRARFRTPHAAPGKPVRVERLLANLGYGKRKECQASGSSCCCNELEWLDTVCRPVEARWKEGVQAGAGGRLGMSRQRAVWVTQGWGPGAGGLRRSPLTACGLYGAWGQDKVCAGGGRATGACAGCTQAHTQTRVPCPPPPPAHPPPPAQLLVKKKRVLHKDGQPFKVRPVPGP